MEKATVCGSAGAGPVSNIIVKALTVSMSRETGVNMGCRV
jgi:hypothetical protein